MSAHYTEKSILRLCFGLRWRPQRKVRKLKSITQRCQSTSPAIAQEAGIKNGGYQRLPSSKDQGMSGLQRLPTTSLLRNLVLGAFFTSPILFKPGFAILRVIANSRSPLLNVDSNPVLRAIIKPLVYNQFCAGRDRPEICRTRDMIRGMGYSGVILCYGREIQVSSSNELRTTWDGEEKAEIEEWKKGNLETLDMVGEGDWIGIKLTGAGSSVTNALMKQEDPSPAFVAAMDAICEKAKAKGCRMWIDAEQQTIQRGIDLFTFDLMRKYNTDGNALVYNTIQAYLKASRDKLKEQLALADKENWTLAIKLVRGAYINNDIRERIHDTKKDTDESYDGIVRDLLTGKNLGFSQGKFPRMKLFLAGHNPTSVAAALDGIQKLNEQGKLNVVPDFGQLQGMADELGCKILQRCESFEKKKEGGAATTVVPRIYRCLTWGSIQECMQYLVRRVVENSSGTDRMKDGLSEYWTEVKRRAFRGRRAANS